MVHLYEQIAEHLKTKTKFRPEIGIICGSGLSGLSKTLHNSETFDYNDIPGFPKTTVPGHTGELVFGLIGSIECVCMRGRFHFYEGNDLNKVILPVRVMRLLGVKLLIVTNAAGGLNPEYNVGDIMVIQDHFGLPAMVGFAPLRGVNDDSLGPRFPSMSDAYDKKLQEFVCNAATKLKIRDRIRCDGVYCGLSGPCYETPTECKFLRSVGGDSVGMSTIPEIIAAKHCGMRVLGLSLITNKVIADKNSTEVPASHLEVLTAVEASGKFVENIVTEIAKKEILGDYLADLPSFEYIPDPSSSHHDAATTTPDEQEQGSSAASLNKTNASGGCCCSVTTKGQCGCGCSCCNNHSKLHCIGVSLLIGIGIFVLARNRHRFF